MAKQEIKPKTKAKQGMPLHQFIATGGKSKDYKGAKKGFK